MQYVVFTKDRFGNPGHPTRRFDQIRRLRRRGRVRIVGGGLSGKPATVVYLNKVFDSARTVDRKFVRVMDPGYNNAGYSVCKVKDNLLIVLCRGYLEMRISDIKGLMQDRRMHRRGRRTIARYKMRRLSVRQQQMLTKFKKPRNIRTTDKTSATLLHGVDCHLMLYGQMYKMCPLPVYQTVNVLENNSFDTRTMTWGPTDGTGYQKSPRTDAPEKTCLLCGTTENLQKHHLIPRKKSGTNVAENEIWLCRPKTGGCHEDVHAGRVYLPIKGIKQNRALGTMGAISGVLRTYKGILRVSASDMAAKRAELGVDKEHGNDAVCAAAALFGCSSVDFSQEVYVPLKKFRRHNRARIHAVRERNYLVDGKIVAQNRRKRCDQKTDSRADLLPLSTEIKSNLVVRPGVKLYKPDPKSTITNGGDVWEHMPTGKRFVVTGSKSEGLYLYSPDLIPIAGKPYVTPKSCRRVVRNQGMVTC